MALWNRLGMSSGDRHQQIGGSAMRSPLALCATATRPVTTGPTSLTCLTTHPDARRRVVRLLRGTMLRAITYGHRPEGAFASVFTPSAIAIPLPRGRLPDRSG